MYENTDNMPHIEMGERSNKLTLADVWVTPKAVQDKLNKPKQGTWAWPGTPQGTEGAKQTIGYAS